MALGLHFDFVADFHNFVADYKDWDYIIDNNGTLEDLFENLREFSKKFKLDYE